MIVHITGGNTKIGDTGNISLPPALTCVPGVPCARQGCYARQCYLRPVVKDHWDENWAYYREDPVGYFRDIYTAIRTRQYPFFRWHVGGDIPDYQYLAYMIHLAHALPQVKFLTYTKRYELNFANFPIIPENIVFVMSCWPGYPLPSINTDLPRFWVQDGRETRIPEDAFECPGKCETCRKCWNLKKGENVVIKKHGRYKGSPDQLFLCLE